MSEPLPAVILPTFDHVETLRYSILAALAQTHANLEPHDRRRLTSRCASAGLVDDKDRLGTSMTTTRWVELRPGGSMSTYSWCRFVAEFRVELGGTRQAACEQCRKLLGQVRGHADRLFDVAQGVLGDDPVAITTEQDADGRCAEQGRCATSRS
jgi:hypothetical protein